jgi:hypothetical protein
MTPKACCEGGRVLRMAWHLHRLSWLVHGESVACRCKSTSLLSFLYTPPGLETMSSRAEP